MKTTLYLSALVVSLFGSVAYAADSHRHDVQHCDFGSVSARHAMDLNKDKSISESEYIQYARQNWKQHVDHMDGNSNQQIDDNEWWKEFGEDS